MKKLTPILLFLTLLIGCGKSTEVTIVDDSGDNILPGESTPIQTTEPKKQTDSFRKIVIGESGEIQTLDPLFANSSSELRVIGMIYDGLTKLDENGNPIGSIAKKFSVTRDSLTYNFTLRDNTFFHNDSRFSSGIGRQVTPQDIMMNFRRMAALEVPDNAAMMFGNIRGFNAFHSEQTNIKIPGNRVINSIEGISSDTDSTITFRLTKKDPDFLNKLAHPLGSIYPRESLPENKLPISRPVGSGEFYLAQRQDNTLILASFDNYYNEKDLPTRVDIIHGKKEGDIYQDFAKGNIDAIIEPAPNTLDQVADSSGLLSPIFEKTFTLSNQYTFNTINLYHNSDNSIPEALSLLKKKRSTIASIKPFLGNIIIPDSTGFEETIERNSIQIAYTENPAEVFLIDKIANTFSDEGLNVVLNSSYAVTDEVTFSTRIFPDAENVLTWNFPVYILAKPTVSGISITHKPWNISFQGAIVNKK